MTTSSLSIEHGESINIVRIKDVLLYIMSARKESKVVGSQPECDNVTTSQNWRSFEVQLKTLNFLNMSPAYIRCQTPCSP